VVPTDVSHVSDASIDGDRRDAWDATERIDGGFVSTGGRKVAGSNPVAPITRTTAWEATLKGSRSCRKAVLAGWRYQPWYQESSPHVPRESLPRSASIPPVLEYSEKPERPRRYLPWARRCMSSAATGFRHLGSRWHWPRTKILELASTKLNKWDVNHAELIGLFAET